MSTNGFRSCGQQSFVATREYLVDGSFLGCFILGTNESFVVDHHLGLSSGAVFFNIHPDFASRLCVDASSLANHLVRMPCFQIFTLSSNLLQTHAACSSLKSLIEEAFPWISGGTHGPGVILMQQRCGSVFSSTSV